MNTSLSMPGHETPAEFIQHRDPNFESPESDIFMDDGMDPTPVPARITRQNIAEVFGGALPEGLSMEMFGEGNDTTLELAEG